MPFATELATRSAVAILRSMPRPPREPATPSALAPALLRWAEVRALDVGELAERGGLVAADATHDEVPVTGGALAAMLALASELAAEPHVGLRLPAELVFRRYDAGALAARVAATPGDVLAAVARFASLVFPRLEARFEGGVFSFHARERHVQEYVLAFALQHCRRGGALVVPARVTLASPRAGDLAPLFRVFGTEDVELGAETTSLVLARETASLALPAFDPMLVAAAEQLASAALAFAPRAALADAVTARIEKLLPTGAPTAEAVAAAMKMSARTLQRRLEDEGVRFSALVDDVRERIARRLLRAPDLALGEIAARLGFADLATFSRAFKRWTGVPPGAFRRQP